jgi:hypothetical protein
MNKNRLFIRSRHNRLLLSLLSFKRKGKTGTKNILDGNLIQVALSAAIQTGLPICIMVLLVKMRTLKSDKEMRKRKGC